ncbi:putative quinol monooxygenase [Robiginitalea marina]|uniref:Antibiotic biosynthesis monooxygenase n=1 Tax=Robiginitalea marina TaxID=2954105 RepID=A0ABT1B196_9FLAO|nr:antibiotic biosynthesis monooxygenase [Robiginitalea marina]MCO5725637.1 antibiotic biosynthesis monooxygenase [Robiginitalea marina]
MKRLDAIARFRIKPGELGHFKEIAAQMIKAVREKEKGDGCLQYDWFYNEALSECIVREIYRDSDAVLQHMGNVGPMLGKLAAISELSLWVCGSPSEALKKASEGMDITYYDFEAGA